ncbi:MAG: VacJ family lipoprotein [Betaproteobacteria bacterium]|nr:VacJ family lipoprotein [Betaproteobacteria bacterium]MSQ87879.1 VacJ family lipoprotein [Betaproteobacteria bacterium]
MMKRMLRHFLLALLLAGVAGCATTGGDHHDPLEGFNRAVYSFNDGFDEAVGKPVASAYRDLLPGPLRSGVRNFFANLADLWIGANNLLQGKPADTVTDWARFAFNSTVGIFGLIDVATEIGLEKHDEDFGQTFGRWGVGDGAYLVWPILGSSNVRDSVGLVLDFGLDPVLRHLPVRARNALTVLRATGTRADLLDASRILEEAALDKYVFQRDAYRQRRRNLVYDGNPPRAGFPVPRAEASAPEAAMMDAAVRLLEQPASLAASTGG